MNGCKSPCMNLSKKILIQSIQELLLGKKSNNFDFETKPP